VHAEEPERIGVISLDDLVGVWRGCHLATLSLAGAPKAAESNSFGYSDQARAIKPDKVDLAPRKKAW